MGAGEWVLAGLVAIAFAFVILRPDLWGRRGRDASSSDDGTAVGVSMDGRHRSDHDNDDGDGGDGGDGGD